MLLDYSARFFYSPYFIDSTSVKRIQYLDDAHSMYRSNFLSAIVKRAFCVYASFVFGADLIATKFA